MSLADNSHVDKCRRCGDLVIRGEMLPARKVIIRGNPAKSTARGYYCLPCVNYLR